MIMSLCRTKVYSQRETTDSRLLSSLLSNTLMTHYLYTHLEWRRPDGAGPMKSIGGWCRSFPHGWTMRTARHRAVPTRDRGKGTQAAWGFEGRLIADHEPEPEEPWGLVRNLDLSYPKS